MAAVDASATTKIGVVVQNEGRWVQLSPFWGSCRTSRASEGLAENLDLVGVVWLKAAASQTREKSLDLGD